ncbi:MAG: hypothetical protein Q4P66_08045 [Actinomycetaceae bacterium]|nr:hypothetical protein [Actinomycetaceae bacterium]
MTNQPIVPSPQATAQFWKEATVGLNIDALAFYVGNTTLGTMIPPTFTFGLNKAESDIITRQVLAGHKTAIATMVNDSEDPTNNDQSAENTNLLINESLIGRLSIMCSWQGYPLGVIRTDSLRVARLNDIDEDFAHATADCEPDVSGQVLPQWRQYQQAMRYQRATELPLEAMSRFLEDDRWILETFTLLYPKPRE